MIATAGITALTAFAIAVVLTPALRAAAHRVGYLDLPNERSSHAEPTPRNGGIAIVAGILGAFALYGRFDVATAGYCAAVLVLALLAFFDERQDLPVWFRFGAQLAVATGLAVVANAVIADGTLRFVPHALLLALSVVWLTGVLNAYNFMDGLNGMAASEAIVCGVAFGWLAAAAGDRNAVILAIAVAGAAAGFLPWNLPSGSIFMGDIGSSALGILLATLTLRLTHDGVPFVAAVLPLAPFLLDSSITLLRRALRGERVYTPHRTHYYQRLNQRGWSHAAVTATWALLAVLSSVAAIAYVPASLTGRVAIVAFVAVMHAAVFITIDHRRATQR